MIVCAACGSIIFTDNQTCLGPSDLDARRLWKSTTFNAHYGPQDDGIVYCSAMLEP